MTTTRRITTTTAAILALAPVTAPIATARPLEDPAIAANQAPTAVYSRPDKAEIPVTPYGVRPAATSSPPQTVVRIQTPPGGFDWGDAGIGAAGGLALAMLGVGGGLVVSQRRGRTRHGTA
jgi:hypothetical protein